MRRDNEVSQKEKFCENSPKKKSIYSPCCDIANYLINKIAHLLGFSDPFSMMGVIPGKTCKIRSSDGSSMTDKSETEKELVSNEDDNDIPPLSPRTAEKASFTMISSKFFSFLNCE